jgi:3-dehydroquinate dehydratase-2
MKIAIINGPNLNLLGKRETDIYGTDSFEAYFSLLQKKFPEHELVFFQSNVEGELINFLHQVGFTYDGILLNAGGYTHTSIALADAVAAIKSPVVEVHISNIFAREEFRHVSFLGAKCVGSISGLGLQGYDLALHYLMNVRKH